MWQPPRESTSVTKLQDSLTSFSPTDPHGLRGLCNLEEGHGQAREARGEALKGRGPET